MYTRRLALEEGLFVGMSSGSAIKGVLQLKEKFKPEDVVVVLFHDSGSRYVGKIFNDEWMRERGYLDTKYKKVADLIQNHIEKPLVIVKTEELVSHALERMQNFKISQIPVVNTEGFVGSLSEANLFQAFIKDRNIAEKPIKELMGKPYPIVESSQTIEEVSKLITPENQAVLVKLDNGKYHIITKYDIIRAIQ